MTRHEYYQNLRKLAQAKRIEYGVTTSTLNLTLIRKIFKSEGVKIDSWDLKGRNIKAAYFCDNEDASILVNKNLPPIPKLFALVHELKHHLEDQDSIRGGELQCGDYNANELIEKGAEVFAAEFIYPESEMLELATKMKINSDSCTPEQIVRFKKICPAKVSYQFITKRFERFRFWKPANYGDIKFQNLEEKMYGTPTYKQAWFQERRARKKAIKVR
jgi:Zn-dependent peptidase ImmA (M78 family)